MHRLCVCMVVGIAMATVGCSSSSQTHTRGLTVSATPSAETYIAGSPVRLTLEIANNGGASCHLISQPDGPVTFVSMTRDGSPITPAVTSTEYINGFSDSLKQSFRELAPGQTLKVDMASSEFGGANNAQSLETAEMDVSNEATTLLWPVNAPGKYVLAVRYALPLVDDAPADLCDVPADPVPVEFTVRAP